MKLQERPITIAASTYDEECERSFEDDLCYYIANGWVYSGEEAFVMAKPISKLNSDKCLDSNYVYQKKDWDTWFVYLAAGNGVKRFQELAPFPLANVAWHRRTNSKLRFHAWKEFKKKSRKGIKNGKSKN